jgi:type I restriction-modification system DNA methylase subunit
MDKNAWFSFLHNLHNIVRNGKGIKLTGIPALNEINNFLLLKFLEPKIEEYGLPDNCKFSVLYEDYCTDEKIKQDEKEKNLKDKNYYNLWDEYCNVRGSDPNNDAVIKLFVGHEIISKYIKNDVSAICTYIDKPESGINIQKLINAIYKKYDEIAKIKKKHINELTLDDWNFDAFGLAYEQWKSESVSEKGKKTGQHFTPVELKTWMMKELNPKASEIFYEPACGTGGFITTAYKYVKDTKQDIKKFRNNIYANECNPEVFKPLMINMLIHEIPVDNIHSEDLLNAFWFFYKNPKYGEVYNIGGGRENSVSILEAISLINNILNYDWTNYEIIQDNRIGDHICYYSDLRKIKSHYPNWDITKSLQKTFEEIFEAWHAKNLMG